MKTKKAVDQAEVEARKIHLPPFYLGYSLFVLCGILCMLIVLFFVVFTSKNRSGDLMLHAVLIVELAGIGYFLPFYFLPEVLGITKYERLRKTNLVFLIINTILFSCFYPILSLLFSLTC